MSAPESLNTKMIGIPVFKSPAYECSAILFALLACPEGSEEEQGRIYTALCALFLRAMRSHSSEILLASYIAKPVFALSDAEVKAPLRTFDRRIRDRRTAANMAIPFLRRAESEVPKLPASVKRLSLNQLADFVLPKAGQSEPVNVMSRIWTPTLPVIHLAVAFEVALAVRGQTGFPLDELALDRPFLRELIVEAAYYEMLIVQDRRLAHWADHLVSIQAT